MSGADQPPVGRASQVAGAGDARPIFVVMGEPTEEDLVEDVDESEDDRVAAEEASEVGDEDDAAARDAREGRIPG